MTATADRDPDERLLLQLAFERVLPSLTVVYLESGQEAVDYLRRCSSLPELLITDLHMHIVNGHELVQRVRQASLHRSLPVVVMSTSSATEDRRRCYGAGANRTGGPAFLPKPATLHEVADLVRLIGRIWLWDHGPQWHRMNSGFL